MTLLLYVLVGLALFAAGAATLAFLIVFALAPAISRPGRPPKDTPTPRP